MKRPRWFPTPILVLIPALLWPACALQMDRQGDDTETRDAPIVGGSPATAQQYMSTVALVKVSDGQQQCTGTLIAPTVVLTAAHCLFDDQTNAPIYQDPSEVGIAHSVLDAQATPPPPLVLASRLVYHNTYPAGVIDDAASSMGRDDDIALVILSSPITTLGVAKIPTLAQFDSLLQTGTMITITGYGHTAADLSDNAGVLYIAQTPYQKRSSFEFHVGGTGNPDTCQGDSGGPAYIVSGGTTYVLGATARGIPNGNCGDGGIFTLAPAYEQWIKDNSGGAYPPPAPKKKKGCSVSGDQTPAWPAVFALSLAFVWLRRRSVVARLRGQSRPGL